MIPQEADQTHIEYGFPVVLLFNTFFYISIFITRNAIMTFWEEGGRGGGGVIRKA